MKKLIILLLMGMSSATFCTLRFDEQRGVYYSENASKNVNQDEYNKLVCELMSRYRQGILNLTAHQLAVIFTDLRLKGTPAALQLIRDTEEGIKQYKKEMKRIQNL